MDTAVWIASIIGWVWGVVVIASVPSLLRNKKIKTATYFVALVMIAAQVLLSFAALGWL
jgi:uncharacterized membrane protein